MVDNKMFDISYKTFDYNLQDIYDENIDYILTLISKCSIFIELNNKKYFIYKKFKYNIVTKIIDSIIKIIDPYNIQISNPIVYINISEYGKPSEKNLHEYEIVYSFDKNYLSGAFASLYSLLYNFNESKKKMLQINFIFSDDVLDYFYREYDKLNDILNITCHISIYIINKSLVNENIKHTKCFKGGNHLLNVANYGRLLICQLFSCNQLLYLDSDTIIQSDLSICFDSIKNKNYTISGKKSNLTFKNILIAKNYNIVRKIFSDNFNINENIIYTGTLFIRPKKFKLIFDRVSKIVDAHNNLPDGLYKLFTMSIINLCIYDRLDYFDTFLTNVVDLGFKSIDQKLLDSADVLDWSGIQKPWFTNGLYKDYWKKYNLLFDEKEEITINNNTVETFT